MTISHLTTAHFTDALTGKPFTHLHLDSTSRDCDGRYDRTYVETPHEGQTFRELWEWRVRHETTFLHSSGDEYPATLTVGDRMHEVYGGDDYDVVTGVYAYPVLHVYKADDEGYSAREWRMCADEFCIHQESTFRDHTAEAAGY